MKKITFLFLFCVCAVGFSQSQTIQDSGATTSSYLDYTANRAAVNTSIPSGSRATSVTNANGILAITTFTDLAAFQAAAGTLVSEDFSNGPASFTTCGSVVSSAGDACFLAGELEAGFDLQASNASDIIFIGATALGANTIDLLGSSAFAEFTIINFTGPDDVFAVGMEIWNNLDPDTDFRVFDNGGVLLESYTLNNAIGTDNFFGFVSTDAIGSIEIEGFNASGELFGSLSFTASGGGGGGCPIVSDCNLMDTVPDDATSPNTWVRPIGIGPGLSGSGPVGYEMYGPFTVDTSGAYTLTNAYTGFDGYIHLYETCFDPLDQLTNLLAGNDDFGGVSGSQILDQALVTGAEYYVVTSGYGAGSFGDYTLEITGAGVVMCGGGTPPPTGDCVLTDATGLPFDIDGAGNSTADCAAAPNEIPVTISESGIIGTDVVLDFAQIDILHSFAADLDIFLVSPTGTSLALAEDNGGGTDDAYNMTQFSDGGLDINAAPAGTQFGMGPYAPEGGTFAATFDGEEINGDWILRICDDAAGDTGSVQAFSINFCPPSAPITNDLCENAINVECGDVVLGDTTDDTDSGGNAAPDEFYTFTGDGVPQDVTLSLCDGGTAFDSLIRVFTDCTLTTEIVSNDDSCGLQSELEFESDGTSTYFIMIEGFGANAGAFSLAVTCASPVDNDLCENAIEIACGASVTGTTTAATVDNDVAGADCGTTITAPGVWYEFVDNTGLVGTATATLCNGTDFDSKISIFSGDCAALVCIDGNDDDCGVQSTISFPTDGATTFYILVHGFAGNTGNFTLDVTCLPTPPPNDMIANSIDVDQIGFPYTDSAVAMPAATLEAGDPADCSINGSAGVWYNFVSGGNGTATAAITTPGGASSVIFYSAPDENAVETDLVHVNQFNNQCLGGTTASIATLAGQAYYVFVVNTGAITDVVIDGTLLGTNDNTIEGFSFYPNPASNILNVTAQNTIDSVSLYNVLGQVVVNQTVGATSSSLDVSSLATGTYIMKVSVDGEIGTYKVIKQ